MTYLFIETVALQPHLETSGEIALTKKQEGKDVTFLWLGEGLSWNDFDLDRKYKLLGLSLKTRKRRFFSILESRGVNIVADPGISPEIHVTCRSWANAFNGSLVDLKLLKYRKASLGMGVASSFLSKKLDSELDTSKHMAQIREALYTAAVIYEKSLIAIEKIKPEVIFSHNGRFATNKPIFEAARQKNVPILRHERGATFQQYEIFEKPIHDFEYRELEIKKYWEKNACGSREEMGKKFFMLRRQGDGIGWRSYITGQTSGYYPAKIAKKRRVVYFSSSDDEFAAISDTAKQTIFGEQLEAVRTVIDLCATLDDVELIVRVHPNIQTKSKAQKLRWYNLASDKVSIIAADEKVDSYGLLDSADIVVTYGSTIGIEAAYWGKPSILLGPCAYRSSGAVYVPSNRRELKSMLSKACALDPLPEVKSLPFGYYLLTFGKNYSFYQPENLFSGLFCGQNLDWTPHWLRAVKFYIKKLLK